MRSSPARRRWSYILGQVNRGLEPHDILADCFDQAETFGLDLSQSTEALTKFLLGEVGRARSFVLSHPIPSSRDQLAALFQIQFPGSEGVIGTACWRAVVYTAWRYGNPAEFVVSLKTLAQRAGVTEKTVRMWLRRFQKAGYLERLRQGIQGMGSSVYRLNLSRGAEREANNLPHVVHLAQLVWPELKIPTARRALEWAAASSRPTTGEPACFTAGSTGELPVSPRGQNSLSLFSKVTTEEVGRTRKGGNFVPAIHHVQLFQEACLDLARRCPEHPRLPPQAITTVSYLGYGRVAWLAPFELVPVEPVHSVWRHFPGLLPWLLYTQTVSGTEYRLLSPSDPPAVHKAKRRALLALAKHGLIKPTIRGTWVKLDEDLDLLDARLRHPQAT